MAVNEIGKIIVHKTPTILHENITLSRRNNNNLVILPKNSNAANCLIYLAYSFWNMFIQGNKNFKEIKIYYLYPMLQI